MKCLCLLYSKTCHVITPAAILNFEIGKVMLCGVIVEGIEVAFRNHVREKGGASSDEGSTGRLWR